MRKTYALLSGWSFRHSSHTQNQSIEVELPHTWNADFNYQRGEYQYEQILNIDSMHKHDHIFLEFLGANSVCRVYLNDIEIGEHRGGYSTFRFEITRDYDWDSDNHLRVVVSNEPTQDVSPLMGDFSIYGGLYRPVNLICVPQSHFDLLFYGSSGIMPRTELDSEGNGVIKVESHVVNGKALEIQWSILDPFGNCVLEAKTDATSGLYQFTIKDCLHWNGKRAPNLYEIEAKLVSGLSILDEVSLKVGFRNCFLDPEKGFFLNENPFRVHGISKHQDFGSFGNATQIHHIKKDFDLIDEIGANAIRLSHYQHSQETYDMCDQLGYVTWAEIPMLAMPDKEGVLENAKLQLMELVYQNCHHPSICFWGIQNEIAMGGETLNMYSGVHELNDLFHDILPESISVSANMYYVKNDSPMNAITDMLGYNLYYGWYYEQIQDLSNWFDKFHQEYPNMPLGLSEYGADCNLSFHSSTPKVKDYSEEYQTYYHEQTYAIIESKPYLWGSFLWNMFDFGSEVRDEGGTKGLNCKGLVTIDRETKKDSFYYYKSRWSKEPFVHICEKRFVNRSEDVMAIKVFSTLKQLTLYLNDVEIASQEGEGTFIFENVSLSMGENSVKVSGMLEGQFFSDEANYIRVESPDMSYVYVDPNPGLVVENWFTQGKSELDFFPEGVYSIKDKIGDLMASEDAWKVLEELAPKVVERATPGGQVTLLWVFNKMRAFFSEEAILEINERLTKIKK